MSSRDVPVFNQAVAEHVSSELIQRADGITDAWLADVAHAREQTLPESAQQSRIEEQGAEMLRSLAEFIRSPSDECRAIVIDRLRIHADRRREEGYGLQQLFTEYEMLSRLVFRAFTEAVKSYVGDPEPVAVAQLGGRLREGLMEITSEAVGLYRQRELEQRTELARRLSTFAEAITHELKNPLGAAQAGAQMLREKDVAASVDQQDRFIKLVLRNLVRVHDLIDEIRSMAVAPAGDAEQHARLTDIIAKVFDELREEANKKGVGLEIDGTLPDAWLDSFRAEIILVNLVGNAIKYSDPTKPRRWVRVSTKASELTGHHRAWAVTIRDNGIGIPTALHSSVFRRHFRAHPQVAEGTGLGLAITAEVANAADGRVTFESEEGVGTSFHVVLPDHQLHRRANDAPIEAQKPLAAVAGRA